MAGQKKEHVGFQERLRFQPRLKIAHEQDEEEMRQHELVRGVDQEAQLKAEPLLPAVDDEAEDWGQEVGAAAGALEVCEMSGGGVVGMLFWFAINPPITLQNLKSLVHVIS